MWKLEKQCSNLNGWVNSVFADFLMRQANGKKTTNNAIASTVSVPSWYSRRRCCWLPESCSESAFAGSGLLLELRLVSGSSTGLRSRNVDQSMYKETTHPDQALMAQVHLRNRPQRWSTQGYSHRKHSWHHWVRNKPPSTFPGPVAGQLTKDICPQLKQDLQWM